MEQVSEIEFPILDYNLQNSIKKQIFTLNIYKLLHTAQ
jgi:hypothetical protein